MTASCLLGRLSHLSHYHLETGGGEHPYNSNIINFSSFWWWTCTVQLRGRIKLLHGCLQLHNRPFESHTPLKTLSSRRSCSQQKVRYTEPDINFCQALGVVLFMSFILDIPHSADYTYRMELLHLPLYWNSLHVHANWRPC